MPIINHLCHALHLPLVHSLSLLLITRTSCYIIKETQDQDFSCSFSDSLSLWLSLWLCLSVSVNHTVHQDQLETELGLHTEELKAIANNIHGCSELARLGRRRRKGLVTELRQGIASAFIAAAQQVEDEDLSSGFRVVTMTLAVCLPVFVYLAVCLCLMGYL